jgi:hypothetical protein
VRITISYMSHPFCSLLATHKKAEKPLYSEFCSHQ